MRHRVSAILVTACLFLAPTAALCDLAPYSQDFEGLDQADPAALTNEGWLVFANVFFSDGNYHYGYGPFPAPNGGPGFSAVAAGEGGPSQGAQQLVVYSDYNNGDHALGKFIEANVFQEQVVGAADVGTAWLFEFDAKRGDIGGGTTALAFFKTLDPNNNYWLTNFITINMTGIPAAWDSYVLSIFIDPSLEGQILQFGFLSTATLYEPSGILYDNVTFRREPLGVSFDVRPGSCPNPFNGGSRGVLPTAVLGTEAFDVGQIDVTTLRVEGVAPVRSGYEDVAAPFAGELANDVCGCSASGRDGILDLTLKFDTQDLALASEDGKLKLTGALLDGTPIEGLDCIVLVGRGQASAPTVQGTSAGGSNSVGFNVGVSNVGSETAVPHDDSQTREELLRDKHKSTSRRVRSQEQ